MPNLAYSAEADLIVSNDPHILDAEIPLPVEVVSAAEAVGRLGL